jgi:hypothetical protein
MKSNRSMTSKQKKWLAHIRSCRRSGQSVAAYAREQNLSAPQLYTWIVRLRALGALVESPAPQVPSSKQHPRPKVQFSPVRLIETAEPGVGLRIRFGNGVVLETSGAGDLDPGLITTLASLP